MTRNRYKREINPLTYFVCYTTYFGRLVSIRGVGVGGGGGGGGGGGRGNLRWKRFSALLWYDLRSAVLKFYTFIMIICKNCSHGDFLFT